MKNPADPRASSDAAAALPLLAEDGTDLTVIRWMLALSVEERLAWLQTHMNSVAAIRSEPAAP